jgi:hypothetical protein
LKAELKTMKIPLWAKLLLTAAICGGAIFLVTNVYFAGTAMPFVFFTLTLASVILVLFRVGRSWLDLPFVAVAAALLGVISVWHFNYQPNWESCVSFVGLASLVVLGLRAVWSEGEKQKILALAFAPSFLFAAFMVFAGAVLERTQIWHPKVLDLYLFSFDASLHVQLAFVMGQMYSLWPWFKTIGTALYIGLPIPLAMVYSGHLVRNPRKVYPAMAAFLLTGPIGILFYNLFPALGPVHIFLQDFPWHPMNTLQASHLLREPIAVKGVQNAIPSLHMAWVLLAWWYSRGLSVWERGIALTFVVFTAFATLGTGEHYFIDLVGARARGRPTVRVAGDAAVVGDAGAGTKSVLAFAGDSVGVLCADSGVCHFLAPEIGSGHGSSGAAANQIRFRNGRCSLLKQQSRIFGKRGPARRPRLPYALEFVSAV